MFTMECPSCGSNTTISLDQSLYEGPYRCWKCRGLFRVRIENEELQTCEPLSEEEFEREQQIESLGN
jgi:hypothetical protein